MRLGVAVVGRVIAGRRLAPDRDQSPNHAGQIGVQEDHFLAVLDDPLGSAHTGQPRLTAVVDLVALVIVKEQILRLLLQLVLVVGLAARGRTGRPGRLARVANRLHLDIPFRVTGGVVLEWRNGSCAGEPVALQRGVAIGARRGPLGEGGVREARARGRGLRAGGEGGQERKRRHGRGAQSDVFHHSRASRRPHPRISRPAATRRCGRPSGDGR